MIVLSNNDGCAVARSVEAKRLGIEMGEPWLWVRALCEREGVAAFSSNYTLYGDMSRRVNHVLEGFTSDVEVYSIDESFLGLDGLRIADRVVWGHDVRATVLRDTGIPTCAGLGATKMLAKVANKAAKAFSD